MTLSFFWPLPLVLLVWARCYWRLSGRVWKSIVGLLHVYRHDAGDGVAGR